MTTHDVICLCGSEKFSDEFGSELWILEDGHVSVGVIKFDEASDNALVDEPENEMFDNKHFREIEQAKELRVINVGGFIGVSTARVIKHAQHMNKLITYSEPL